MIDNQIHHLGCDRSDYHLDLTLLEAADEQPEHTKIPARAAELSGYLGQWRRRYPRHQLAVCFEQPAANLIAMFSRFEFVILYAINPATLASYRDAFVTSGAKDDPSDSYWLADLVRTHADKLTAWNPHSPQLRRLAALVQARREAVNLLTAHNNRLISLLKSYYPEALELIGENHTASMAVDFLCRWPTLQQLKKSRWSSVLLFYRKHRCVRKSALERRRKLIEHAEPISDDAALLEPAVMHLKLILGQITPLTQAIDRYARQIQVCFQQHPDHGIVASFPGAGPVFAPRLLAAIGEHRDRFEDAPALQCFSGIAPVMKRSGNMCWVKRRHACPKFIRQSFHEWAGESIRHCRWARAFYA